MHFSYGEKKQYHRHLILDEIGEKGQLKLKKSRVLVVGAGGLGCPILQYLTASGIGNIGIIDADTVEISNLQRQVLFRVDDLGKNKATCAAERLKKLNPFINFNPIDTKLTKENALSIFSKYDIIVDGSDNFPTRYLVNDACDITKKPLVFGAIFKFKGQVSVFHYRNGPTYRCIFPNPPEINSLANCSQVGVLGVLPGIIGTIQANEVIKIILGRGKVLSGELLTLDTMTMEWRNLKFKKNNSISIRKLTDYDNFCSSNTQDYIPEISYQELIELQKKQPKTISLVDVRTLKERNLFSIGGIWIPLDDFDQKINEIPKNKKIVIYCQSGKRSKLAVGKFLQKFKGYNIVSLHNGIEHLNKNNLHNEKPSSE